eukprot:3937797-Rhodomonas_salina.2
MRRALTRPCVVGMKELGFLSSPASGMLYPGEGPGGRRRQDAVAAWRSEHAELPVAEALKGFKSR